MFPHPNSHVRSVAFSPDGSRLVSGCDDGVARIWRVPRPGDKPLVETRPLLELVHHKPGGTNGVYSVAFPSTDLVVTGSRGDGACLWRIADASPPRVNHGDANMYPLTRHGGTVFAVGAWREGPRTRVLVGGAGTAEVWELIDAFQPETGEWQPRYLWSAPLPGHAARLGATAFSPDGRTCLTADHGGLLRLWDADGLTLIGQPIRHKAQLHDARFDPTGRRVALAGDDGSVAVWGVPGTNAAGPPLDHDTQPVLDAWFGPDGEIRTATLGRVIHWAGDPPRAEPVWDRDGQEKDAEARRRRSVMNLVVAPDGGAVLLCALGFRSSRVWGPPRFGPDGAALPDRVTVEDGAFSPDGQRLLTLHGGGATGKAVAAMWDVTGDTPQRVPGWGDPGLGSAHAAAFAPDGHTILVGGATGAVWVDAATGRIVGEPIPAPAAVTAVAVRDDGATAVGCQDGTIRVWAAAGQPPLGPPMQAAGAVTSLMFGPAGVLLAASADRSARFWDATTGLPLGPPTRHRGPVSRARFAPDGRSVLTAGADGLVRRWKVPGSPAAESAEDLAARVGAVTGLELGRDGVPRPVP
jgi:WD40 repeat protein